MSRCLPRLNPFCPNMILPSECCQESLLASILTVALLVLPECYSLYHGVVTHIPMAAYVPSTHSPNVSEAITLSTYFSTSKHSISESLLTGDTRPHPFIPISVFCPDSAYFRVSCAYMCGPVELERTPPTTPRKRSLLLLIPYPHGEICRCSGKQVDS